MTPEKLAELINDYFKPPFVEEGHVRAWVTSHKGYGPSFNLRVGNRDIAIDWEKCEVWASGTMLVQE